MATALEGEALAVKMVEVENAAIAFAPKGATFEKVYETALSVRRAEGKQPCRCGDCLACELQWMRSNTNTRRRSLRRYPPR